MRITVHITFNDAIVVERDVYGVLAQYAKEHMIPVSTMVKAIVSDWVSDYEDKKNRRAAVANSTGHNV